MTSCPKCSSRRIVGPHYQNHYGYEALRYTCAQCGYSETTPTDDAKRADESFAGLPERHQPTGGKP